jgi:membrane protein YqaA with SNARE-associated domain
MSPIRSTYDWALRQSEGPYAPLVLFIVAFAESSFFPLPPDVLLLPMAIAAREKAYRFAAICTIASVLGGFLGYAIGAFLYDSVGQWIIHTYHLEAGFQRFHDQFNTWGVWIILAKGLTPIPFKLVTIASGVAKLNLISFGLAAAGTRALRFFLVALLVRIYGAPIKVFVEKYLTWVALGVLVLIVLGFWLVLHA